MGGNVMFTQAERQEWDERGYLYLGQVASDALLAAMQQRIDDLMMGRIPNDAIWFQLDSDSGVYSDVPGGGKWAGATLNYRKIEALERDPVFLEYIQLPKFRAITEAVYGPDVAIYRSMFMNKPAQKGTILPYHQDAGSQWRLSKDPVMTIWTALDDATIAKGCMQVIPGSHKLGLLSEHGHTITPEQEAQYARDENSVYLEAKAGEAILLNNLMLHRSGVNSEDTPRRAFSVCYMDADTRSTVDGRSYPKVFGEGALRVEEAVTA
jgi:phytanoyl-CoA hydroxylase